MASPEPITHTPHPGGYVLDRIKSWLYADGLSSLLHALVVLIPSVAVTHGGAPLGLAVTAIMVGLKLKGVTSEFIPRDTRVLIGLAVISVIGLVNGPVAGILYAVAALAFYTKRELGPEGDLAHATSDEKRDDSTRDILFPALGFFMAVGIAADKLLGG